MRLSRRKAGYLRQILLRQQNLKRGLERHSGNGLSPPTTPSLSTPYPARRRKWAVSDPSDSLMVMLWCRLKRDHGTTFTVQLPLTFEAIYF